MLLGVSFSETINLGAVVLGAILALSTIVRVISTIPTRQENSALKIENASLTRQLGECRSEIMDKARRLSELGMEKDVLQQSRSAVESRAQTLQEQIDGMPDWEAVQHFTESLLEHVDKAAAERQLNIARQIADLADRNDERASQRQQGVIENQRIMLELIREVLSDAKEAHAARRQLPPHS